RARPALLRQRQRRRRPLGLALSPQEARRLARVGRMPIDAGALHVTNGDSAAATLRETGLVGDRLVVWRDVLPEGPVPAVDDARLRAVRAEFLGADPRDLAERDGALAAGRDGDYVLWFEADLYDQLQLVQILAALSALEVAPERLTLICIGEHL